MRQRLSFSVVIILGAFPGCASETDSPTQTDSCTEQIDRYAERVADCRPLSDDDRTTAIARCESSQAFTDPWRPEFRKSVDDCSATLTCENFVEDLDDICFPIALAAGASGLLAETTIAACISGESEECDQELALGRETGTSFVSKCFRRWAECADQRAQTEPYWTEDYCGTLIALPDEQRMQADSCSDLTCSEVAACLRDAGAFNF